MKFMKMGSKLKSFKKKRFIFSEEEKFLERFYETDRILPFFLFFFFFFFFFFFLISSLYGFSHKLKTKIDGSNPRWMSPSEGKKSSFVCVFHTK